MDTATLKLFGQIAGIGGLALGVLLLLFRDFLQQKLLSVLTKKHSFYVVVLFLILVFLTALAGIGAWLYSERLQTELRGSSSSQVDQIEQVRQKIVGVRGSWEVMINEPDTIASVKTVYNSAPEAGKRMLAFPRPDYLGKEIDQKQWGGYAYYMAADAAYRLGNHKQYKEWIGIAESSIREAQGLLIEADLMLKSDPGSKTTKKLHDDIHRCYDRERIPYLLAMILALRHVAEELDNTEKVNEIVSGIDPERLRDLEVNTKNTPYVKDLLYENNHISYRDFLRLFHVCSCRARTSWRAG